MVDLGSSAFSFEPRFPLPLEDDALLLIDSECGGSFSVVSMSTRWTYALVALNVWSVAGDSEIPSVNILEIIPVVNRVPGKGWFISSNHLDGVLR